VPDSSNAPYRIYNVGNRKKVKLLDYIKILEKQLGKKAVRNELPLQAGDLPDTWADCSEIGNDLGYNPETPLELGIERFVRWYREYFQV
jgi:UDP-glucuronate 4-epimerase